VPAGVRQVHLTSGGPAPEALPADELAEAFAAAARRSGAPGSPVPAHAGTLRYEALQYSDTAGLPRLRAALAVREGVSPDRVVVTNGALHGIWLALTTLVEPGDVVLVDDPVFPDTKRIIENAGGTAVGIPVDRDGLDVDAVEALLTEGLPDATGQARRVKAVYTVPDFQNPSGHVLSAQRRTRLVELAARYGFVVVSDNPYRYQGLSPDLLPDFPADSEHVVRVSTFSKTLGPGLRLGWLVAPSWLAPHLVNVRRRIDFHSGTLTQHAVADLLERPGWFDELAVAARGDYARRARTLVCSLREHVGDRLSFVDPLGGFFVWAEVVAPGVSAQALTAGAAQEGLFFAPGSAFAVGPDSAAHRYVRLAYSQAEIDDLAEAGVTLARVLDRLGTSADGGHS
jgi:2-aminoadipate transaminase